MKDIIFIGDGLGVRTYPSKLMGLDVIGTDISNWAIEHSYCKENMIVDDIVNTKLNEKAKLIVLYDILEHLNYEDLDKALKNIIKFGDNFIFSIPWIGNKNLDEDPTHKIKETKEWWVEKLSKYFKIEDAPVDWLLCKIFGHKTYNQSSRYDPITQKKRKHPYYIKICHRCGWQKRVYLK